MDTTDYSSQVDKEESGRYPPDEASLSPQNDTESLQSVPDGGFTAWMTVGGAWLVMFSTFGYIYAFGVYQDFYTRIYLNDSSASQIAWIGSFQLMMPFLLGIVTGTLFDEGYFHILTGLGSLLFTFSLFMLSLAKPNHYYQVFLSQGLGMGLGLGLLFIPTLSIPVHHFKRHRVFATGVILSGNSAGALVFPIMLSHLIPTIGFGGAVRASAYLVLGFVFIGNLCMRTRRISSASASAHEKPDIGSFFRDGPYLLCMVGAFFISFGLYFPVIYIQLYSVLHNIDANLAFYSLAIMNGSGGVGRLIGNYVADSRGSFNLFVPCAFIVGGTIWAVLGINTAASLVAVSVLYGVFSGAYLSLSIAALASLAKTPKEAGARTGIALALSSLGTLGAAPIQGALLTGSFHWIRPIAFSASLVFVASFLFLWARMMVATRRNTQIV
ncbi:MFS general substrate transporter [Dichomitus squalens]|uniref:MFS general substrate transporter n=1 Tax=Dichomitus squalens TaxID=114155 RepID=A0A4Q9MF37_9APHY|nr:MFS general substrate transporter [Dichomitus squalens]